MDDFIDEINQAFKEMDERRRSQTYQSDTAVSPTSFHFDISDEISDALRQRSEEDERMRHVSHGVYA